MDIFEITIIVLCGIIVLCCILLLLTINTNSAENKIGKFSKIKLNVASIICIIVCAACPYFVIKEYRQENAKWDMVIHNNYTFYVDGQEVDPDNIDKTFYKISYDDESKKVFLTHKSS